MSTYKLQTKLESAIERRNLIQQRLIGNMVDIIYFTKKMEPLKPDTQERVNMKLNVDQSKQNLEDDLLLMEAFDEVIATLKKETNE